MASITFIQQPPFVIDFKQFSPAAKTEEERNVQRAVYKALQLLPVLFASLAQASYLTLKHSGASFKVVVLGFYGPWSRFRPPADFYLLVFKVAFWALGLVWCTVTTAFRLTNQKLFPTTSQFLKNYTSDGIDVSHIRTNEIGIDVSGVPTDVKVDNLAEIFSQINFNNAEGHGYMKDTSRQEGTSTIYTIKELSDALNVFINHVNNRVAFLGTPPAHDMPRLSAFYQQIENAVRFSINKSNQDLAEFKRVNGNGLDGKYEGEQKKKYDDLLHARARIAKDLAIAAKHCGARYMGEAMTIYEDMKGENVEHKGSLQDSIIELLARKRYIIANRLIGAHLGQNVHAHTKYLSHLGTVLGLPGTENIIETLAQTLSIAERDEFLRLFFQEYTIDFIIETIQDEIRRSGIFRAKITDWIRDYPNDWKKQDYAAAVEQFVPQALSQLNAASETPSMLNAIQFQNLVAHLRKTPNILPALGDDMNEFIERLFELEDVKLLRGTEFAALHPLVRVKKLELLQLACTSARLDAEEYNNDAVAALEALAAACMNKARGNQSQQNLDHLSDLIEYLKVAKIDLPKLVDSWDKFISGEMIGNELLPGVFTLPAVKEWRERRFANLRPDQRPGKIQDLRNLCSQPAPNEEELAYLKTRNPTELLTDLCERSRRKLIIERVRSVILLEEDTVVRIMREPVRIQQAVADKLEQGRHIEFLEAFKLEKINEGISPALMEWLTVSQKVLLPQEVRG